MGLTKVFMHHPNPVSKEAFINSSQQLAVLHQMKHRGNPGPILGLAEAIPCRPCTKAGFTPACAPGQAGSCTHQGNELPGT